jgi:hypothetical protein
LGALKKEEIKERGQMSHYEKKKRRRERRKSSIEQPKFSPKSSSFQERYEKKSFSKELSIHHHHSFTPTSPLLTHIPPTIHHLPSSLYTSIS